MPYASNAELPPRVRNNIPSERGKDIFRNVFNSALTSGKSETVAFASAWAALQDAGYERRSDGKYTKMQKRQLNDDQFTRPEEAAALAFSMGWEDGAIHTHETADGIAVYMPGPTHEAYLEWMGSDAGLETEAETEADDMLVRAIGAIMDRVLNKRGQKTTLVVSQPVLKMDEEQRIVYGWASVISENGEPIFDSQGDSITPDVLTKAANEFMQDVRVAKAMHEGEQVGEVIHSLPLTKEIGEALGVSSDREGWIIAMKIHSDEVWEGVKSGKLGAFSIGGEAIRNAVS